MDLEVTKGNVDNEMRERMNGQTINEICEEGIKSKGYQYVENE